MAKEDYPVTLAIRELKQKGIEFEPYMFEYEEKGGTKQTARELNIDEHIIIKTLVFEDETGQAFIVLMHGDREVSQKELARLRGCKRVQPCDPAKALKATGYQFGGTSPFGTKNKLKVYAEKTILSLGKIYINGGKRGFIIAINPADLKKVFEINEIEAAINK